MAIIFLFVDGVGLGSESEHNPFHQKTFKAFELITSHQPFVSNCEKVLDEDHLFMGIDANLGIKGLPQSGTGQTSLFTGINASKKIGRHFGPFPHSELKPILRNKSVFRILQEKERVVTFINAYPEIYFQKAKEKNRWSCTTLMAKGANLDLHTLEDIKKGEAITAGITQKAWKEMLGLDVPVIEASEAALRIIKKAEKFDFILHEFYLTDKAGHGQEMNQAIEVLSVYNDFLLALIENKREQDTLILSSDHGNIENISVKTHTRNKVPLYVNGPSACHFKNVASITDVTPRIVDSLS